MQLTTKTTKTTKRNIRKLQNELKSEDVTGFITFTASSDESVYPDGLTVSSEQYWQRKEIKI